MPEDASSVHGGNLLSSGLQASNSVRLHFRLGNSAFMLSLIELFNVSRILAPRQRKERVRVRAPDGTMLTPFGQFQEIDKYFRSVFAAPEPFSLTCTAPAPEITAAELLATALKGHRSGYF